MVRPRVRPPPIDVVAATSAMSPNSYSPSPSPLSGASTSSTLTNLHKTGLIQILPPQPFMDDLDEINILHYGNSSENESSSSSCSPSTSSNRHATPPQSLPSSPAFTVSPISPTFAGLTHITFADSIFENADSNALTFIPVTWISSSHMVGEDEAHFLCADYSKSAKWSSSSKGRESIYSSSTPTSPSEWLIAPNQSRIPLSGSPLDWPPPPSPILPCSPFQSYSPFPSPLPSPQRQGFYGDYLTAGDFSTFLSNISPSPSLPLERPRSRGIAYPSRSSRSPHQRFTLPEAIHDENVAPCSSQAMDDASSWTRGRTAQRQSRLWNRRARIVS